MLREVYVPCDCNCKYPDHLIEINCCSEGVGPCFLEKLTQGEEKSGALVEDNIGAQGENNFEDFFSVDSVTGVDTLRILLYIVM